MKNHAFLPRKIALAISVASLVACSGDQGSSGSSPNVDNGGPTQPTPVNQVAVRGQVIDGYLSNAFVCIDNNDNFVCDAAGEYRTTTNAEGRFELTVPAGQSVDKLLAQIVPGQTVDMDNPEQTLTKQSVLLPVNVKSGDSASNLVTPFTTVIGALAKESGETVDVVAAKLAEKWALQDDFYSVDYVAANSSNKDAPVRAAAREIQQKWEEVIAKQASDNAGASWSQILASSTTAFASDDVQQDLDNDVQVVVRPAAAVLTIDDAANTLDWAFVAGFDQPQHYEYSVNNGASFQAVSAKPVALENLAYATGQVQLRVRAGVVNNNPVGVAAKNATALTRIIDDIAAPKNLLVNDTQDTLDWDNVSGYSNLSDYEYRITSGSQQRDWQAVNVKPLVIGDFDVAVNAIEIRVKAVASKNLAGQVASNPQAFKAVVRNIAAPTNLVVDDVANTLDWQFVNGFTSAADYEYHTGNGQWQTVNAKPLQVGDVAISAGALQLRVKASAGQIAGASASNGAAFNTVIRNVAAPQAVSDDSANTFSWQLVNGYGQISDYEISIDSAAWRTTTAADRSIAIGNEKRDAGYVRVRVKAIAGLREAGAIAASAAFKKDATAAPAPTNPVVDDVANTFDWTFANGFTDAADYQYRIGNGAWITATAKPVQVGDVAIAVGGVELRVAAVAGEWLASPVIINADAYTIVVTDIAAPQVSGDDTANTFSWSFVAGYNNVSDYEIRINDGSWVVATDAQRTIAIGDVDRDAGYIEVRVKAVAGVRNAGAIAKSPAFKKTLVVAPAPTNLVVNDAVNTLNWTFVSGYTKVSDYQYRIAPGIWQPATTKPIQVGDVAIAVGDLELRIAPIADARLAGQIARNTEAFAEVIRGIAAPVPTSDDDADSFSWALVNGYANISDYEIKVGAADWRVATNADRNINVGDVDQAADYIQVRVAAVNGIREAGEIAKSAEFKKALVSAAAPTGLVVDDAADTLDWSYVAGFTNASDYEYRITSGSQQSDWQTIGAKPLVVGDFDIDANAIEIRVTAVADVRLAGQVAQSPQAFKAVIRNIAAPTNLLVNDVANTLDWTNVAGYTNVADYEFHTGDGNWQVASAKPIEVGDVAIASGALQLRVKAATGREAGATASNATAFAKVITDIAAPATTSDDAADTFSWSFVSGYESISAYEIKIGSADWRVATDSDKSVNVGDENRTAGYVQVRVAAVTGINEAGVIAQSPEFTQVVIVAAPTGLLVNDTEDTLDWVLIADFENAADYQYALVVAGETQAWQNATAKPIQLSDDFVGTVKLRVTGDQNEVAESAAFAKTQFVKLAANGDRLSSTATDFACIKDNEFDGGIYWQKSDGSFSGDIPFRSDNGAIKTVESEVIRTNTANLCGYSDWQPASIAEMQVLAGYTYYDQGYRQDRNHWGNGNFFNYLQDGSYYRYWSRDIPLDEGTPDNTKRRTGYRGFSSFGTGDSTLDSDNYVLLSRVPVVGGNFVNKVQQANTDITTAQGTLPTWQENARTHKADSDSEFAAAADRDALNTLNTMMLARIAETNQRQDTLNTNVQRFEALLTQFRADVNTLARNPDNRVSDAERAQFNAELAKYETALTTYKNAQNSDLTDAVAAISAKQVLVKNAIDALAGFDDLLAKISTAETNLSNAQTNAQDIAALITQLESASPGSATSESLYQKAIASLTELAALQAELATLTPLQQELINLITQLRGAGFNATLIAEFTTTQTRLNNQITAQGTFRGNQQSVTENSVEKAFDLGYSVSLADATVSTDGASFAKLDAKGRYIPKATTYLQGYRCAQDLRFENDRTSVHARVWMVMASGKANSVDQVKYPAASAKVVTANQQKLCGKENWAIPTLAELQSVATDRFNSYSSGLTLDTNVFVHHRGEESEFGSSPRYYYWSQDIEIVGERLALSYAYSSFGSQKQLSMLETDLLDDTNHVFIRLISQTDRAADITKLDLLGNETSDDDQWLCSRDNITGLTWLRPGKLPQADEKRRPSKQLTEVALIKACGSSDWKLPTLAQLSNLVAYGTSLDSSMVLQRGDDNRYLAQEADDKLNALDFGSLAGKSTSTSHSTGYWALWVTASTNTGAPLSLANGYVGLYEDGTENRMGLNYCVKEQSSGEVWTTHLSTDNDAESFPDRIRDNYCAISSSNWSLPTVDQLKSIILEDSPERITRKQNLNGDAIAGGNYWSSQKRKKDPACTSSYCDELITIVKPDGSTEDVEDSYFVKHYGRFIHTSN